MYAGRVDIENGRPKYSKSCKRGEGAVTGVPNSEGVKQGGLIMMITSLSYLLLQGPAYYYQSHGDTAVEVAAGEKYFAGVGEFAFFVCNIPTIVYSTFITLVRVVETPLKQTETQ